MFTIERNYKDDRVSFIFNMPYIKRAALLDLVFSLVAIGTLLAGVDVPRFLVTVLLFGVPVWIGQDIIFEGYRMLWQEHKNRRAQKA